MSGRPGAPMQFARWTRERLLGLGLTDDQLVFCPSRPPSRLAPSNLEPQSFLPEFAPLGQRFMRLLGGGRGLSIYVTGGRNDAAARQHAAIEIALALVSQGREIVVVDGDFLRPGLGGLVSDPLAEGVVDMMRFGRSTRALLQKPSPEGPWVLPAGSFPSDEPVPLDVDGLRSLLHRVAQVCDLALYVGPLPIRSELHPLVRLCDHVVVAAQEDEPDGGPVLVEHVGRLQEQGAHLAGIVIYALQPATAPPAPEPPAPSPAAPPPAPVTFAPGSLYAEEPALPGVEKPAGFEAWPPVVPPPPASVMPPVPTLATPRMPPVPRLDIPPLAIPAAERWTAPPAAPPLADPWAPPAEQPRAAPPLPEPRPESPAPGEDLDLAGAVATRRPREEARGVARDLDLATAEFAFDAETRESRWPLFVVLLLLALIVGFVSWALWTRYTASHVGAPVAPHVEPPSATSGLDDRAASGSPPATQPAAPQQEVPAIPPPRPATEPAPQGPQAGTPAPSPAASEPPTAGAVPPPGSPASPAGAGGAAPSGATAYAVHVASYRTLEQANRDVAALEKLGYEGRAVRTDLGSKGIWYRVYVGSFPSVDEAQRVRGELLKLPEYTFAQVRRLPRE